MANPNDEQDIVSELNGEFSESFEGIETKPFAAQFPRGTYTLESNNAYLGRSMSSGRKQLCMVCKVVEARDDNLVGQSYTKTWGLENEQNIEWLKRDMVALNIEPPKNPKDLSRLTSELSNIKFRAQLVPNREDPDSYPPNMFLNKGAKLEVGGSSTAANF